MGSSSQSSTGLKPAKNPALEQHKKLAELVNKNQQVLMHPSRPKKHNFGHRYLYSSAAAQHGSYHARASDDKDDQEQVQQIIDDVKSRQVLQSSAAAPEQPLKQAGIPNVW